MYLDGVEIYGAEVTVTDESTCGAIYHEEGPVELEDITVHDSTFNLDGSLWRLIYTEEETTEGTALRRLTATDNTAVVGSRYHGAIVLEDHAGSAFADNVRLSGDTVTADRSAGVLGELETVAESA